MGTVILMMEQPSEVTTMIIISILISIFQRFGSLYTPPRADTETESRAALAPGQERVSLNISRLLLKLPPFQEHMDH